MEAARAFLKFWREDTSLHFRKEEEVLLPVMARHGGDLEQDSVVQMLVQHARIRGLAMQVSDELDLGDVQTETLQTLGEQLEAHTRLEERVLFPAIEESLPKEALDEVSSRLEVLHAEKSSERWVPSGDMSFE